jgi:hypothetical protein
LGGAVGRIAGEGAESLQLELSVIDRIREDGAQRYGVAVVYFGKTSRNETWSRRSLAVKTFLGANVLLSR